MDMVDKLDQTAITVKDKVEFLTKVYDRMAGLTTNADTKAGIILAIHSFWAISYGPNLSKLIISFPAQPMKVAVWILSVLLVVAFFIAFIRSASKSAMVLSPRIKPQANEPSRSPGLIYFADIIRLKGNNICDKAHNYKAQFEGMSYEDIIEDLTYRINDIATVVNEKYICAGEAVQQSITTFYLWAISIIFLIMMNMM
jgi:sulfur carrier protein ThiS